MMWQANFFKSDFLTFEKWDSHFQKKMEWQTNFFSSHGHIKLPTNSKSELSNNVVALVNDLPGVYFLEDHRFTKVITDSLCEYEEIP